MGRSWSVLPRALLESTGELAQFTGKVLRQVYGLRVLRFFGEGLRQSGILTLIPE